MFYALYLVVKIDGKKTSDKATILEISERNSIPYIVVQLHGTEQLATLVDLRQTMTDLYCKPVNSS